MNLVIMTYDSWLNNTNTQCLFISEVSSNVTIPVNNYNYDNLTFIRGVM